MLFPRHVFFFFVFSLVFFCCEIFVIRMRKRNKRTRNTCRMEWSSFLFIWNLRDSFLEKEKRKRKNKTIRKSTLFVFRLRNKSNRTRKEKGKGNDKTMWKYTLFVFRKRNKSKRKRKEKKRGKEKETMKQCGNLRYSFLDKEAKEKEKETRGK